MTKKQADYILFKSAYYLILNKRHITNEGILELVALKAVLNKGLSKDLSIAFPDIVPALRSEVLLSKAVDPFWLVGFTNFFFYSFFFSTLDATKRIKKNKQKVVSVLLYLNL